MAKKKRKSRPKAAEAETAAPAREGGGRTFLWLTLGALVIGVVLWQLYPSGRTVPQAMRVRVLRSHPHDPDAFTQGLVYHDGALFESTGLRRHSTLREVDVESGEVRRKVELPDELFAEGLARVGDRFVQLTWQAGKALVWSADGFEKIREHEYTGEGWGLCFDGERLVMSDGTAWLTFRDPETFERIGEVRVTRAGRPVRRLNELECVDGSVYANVWMDDHIARIDPATGEVTAWIDASGLLSRDDRHGGEDVLNGIAYVPETGRFLLTGKKWARLFEVEFAPVE